MFKNLKLQLALALMNFKSWKNEQAEMDVKGVIGVVVVVIIALLLLPLVQSSVTDAQADANTSASASTLLGMVPIFYVLGVVLSAVLWVVAQARQMG